MTAKSAFAIDKHETSAERSLRQRRESETPQYKAGRRAWCAGRPSDACPHREGNERYYWFQGYYSARLADKFGIR